MKRKFFSALLAVMFVLSLFPASAFAAPTMLKSVDIQIELPKGGDPFDMNYTPKITAFSSGNIDLLATGASILYTYWSGDCDYDAYGIPYFRAGGTYYVTIKLALNTAAGYCASYKMSGGEYLVGPDTFSATVNGKTATVSRNAPPYSPSIEISLTLEGDALSETEKAEKSAQAEENKETRRAMTASRTSAEAYSVDTLNLPEKICILNATDEHTLGVQEDYLVVNQDVTTVIIASDYTAAVAWRIPNRVAMREVWVGDQVDVLAVCNAMAETINAESGSHIPFNRADGTLFVSESGAKVLREKGIGQLPFTIKVYSGTDVYAAQKAGASATKDLCTNHQYTAQIRSADRVYTFATCQTRLTYYYSCSICGKCEYNPNHVAYDISQTAAERKNEELMFTAVQHSTEQYEAELPNDSAYIGVNAAGQHVWWKSCALCGHSYSYDILHVNTADQTASGSTNRSFAEYQAQQQAMLKQVEAQVLGSTETYPNTFTLPEKSNANMSDWAQADVNLALNDDLLDDAVLGSDYTKNITRQQFCSIAVRLAETLTGKSITPASTGTFSDTKDTYVLKAYAAGITTGTGGTTFSPNETLTRQQMATFIYRTLRYVEKNSNYKYTDYTSKLSSYSDSAQVQSWATEAMAFMNALELIKGTTDTTLSPNGICTIEQAIAVAGRSVYAHQIGWYQVDLTRFTSTDSAKNGKSNISQSCQFATGQRNIWVTSRRMNMDYGFGDGNGTFQFKNPYTGQKMSISYHDIMPIRG